MIDPILSLSFSMHSNKGVYALLLGSGISRAAGIPTGWEVTLDLIRKLAHLKGENCEPEPAKWYEETFSEDADYSKLLRLVAKTSSERNQLLKGYFEPTEDERQQNIKTPTNAHKAIASLVAKGYIKVILTTNFDRLMERALEEVGVIPTVISTIDAIQGATPITHAPCTLIKLHGDYLDVRIKNTPEELSVYDKRLSALLDRILEEFGLIICGWSGDWDIALRSAIQRCKTYRFTTYWAIKDDLSETARNIANFRRAEFIKIQSADDFFFGLNEKIQAIEQYAQPHPLSAKLAVVTLKKYLEERNQIRIHDLVIEETVAVYKDIVSRELPTQNVIPTKDEFLRRMKTYEARVATLQAMMACLGYWGRDKADDIVIKSLNIFAESEKDKTGYTLWNKLRLYPALILIYSLGLSALANNDYTLLGNMFLKPQNKYNGIEYTPLVLDLYAANVFERDAGNWIPGHEKEFTPVNNYLFETIRPTLRDYIIEERQYEDLFDRFEYLQSLIIADILLHKENIAWGPPGRFGWKGIRYPKRHISSTFAEEISQMSESVPHPILMWFGNSLERLNKAKSTVDESVRQRAWY